MAANTVPLEGNQVMAALVFVMLATDRMVLLKVLLWSFLCNLMHMLNPVRRLRTVRR